MSNITNRLNTVVSKAETDADIFHDVVHGDKTKVVTTDGGNVDSVAKRLSEIPAGQDGLGQYIRYKLENDGTTPTRSSIPTPPIGSDGVLGTVTGWSDTLLAPAANRTLWVAIGHGRASEAVVWSGAYPIQKGDKGETGKQGERGLTGVGTPGLDGLGQYILYANVADGTTPDYTAADTPTIGADGVLPVITDWTVTIPSPVANTKLWGLVGYGIAGDAVTWVSVFQARLKGDKGDKGEQGDWGDGNGYYVYFRYCEEGTPCTKPIEGKINAKGVLTISLDWKKTPEEAALILAISLGQVVDGYVVPDNYVLWFLFGVGKARDKVRWVSIFPTRGQKGEKGATGLPGSAVAKGDVGPQGPKGPTGPAGRNGTNGRDGQDGLGQFRFYGLFDDSPTPSKPNRETIGSDGSLLPPTSDWKSTLPNPVANKTQWVLIGRGKPSTAVFWTGVYKVGDKGDKGEQGDTGKDGVGLPGGRGFTGTKGTDGLNQMRFYYAVDESTYELVVPIAGGLNPVGLLPSAPIVIVKTLADDSISYLSDRWSTSVPDKAVGKTLYTLVGYGKPSTPITWAGVYRAEGKDGAEGPAGKDGASGSGGGALTDGSVTTAKIADYAVTTAKIADYAVTTNEIAYGTIANRNLNRDEVSMLEAYKDPEVYSNVILQKTGNVVYHLRFYGRINADFDSKSSITEDEQEVLPANSSERGDVLYEWTPVPVDSSHVPVDVIGPTIPDNQAKMPHNKDYILVDNERMATVCETTKELEYFDAPTIEGWGRKPALGDYQPGDIVVLEGVARKGDYITWTRTYLYDEREKYEAMPPVARADTYEEYVSGKEDYNNTFLSTVNGKNNTIGDNNTVVGSSALEANTEGVNNTAIGSGALLKNTEGGNNTAIGTGALLKNTDGHDNNGIGNHALINNTEGNYNTASGSYALYNNNTGYSNTAIGIESLVNNTIGYENVAIGANAGGNLRSGSRCILIGTTVHAPNDQSSGILSIGNIMLGDLISGDIIISGELAENSDERLKENVSDVQDGLDCVKKIRPVKYTRKEIPDPVFEKDKDGKDIIPDPAPQGGQRGSNKVHYGLIAQEVEKVCPELVATSEYAEGYKSVNYSRLSILLIKAVQQQQETIEALKKRLEALEN